MRLKGFPNAKTCHSWLYDVEIDNIKDKETNKDKIDPYFAVPEKGISFVPRNLDNIDVLMVDEGGTIPLKMKPHIEGHNKPIIVTGDANQLPPVKDQPAYLTDPSQIIFLDEVMRQQGNSAILYLADRALAGLPIHKGFYGDSIVISDDQLTNEMLLKADMVLSGTNATRDSLNRIIREEILGYKGTLPNFGEKLICRKNNWVLNVDGIGLGNGLTGRVINQPEITDFDGNVFYIDFKPDLFNGVFTNLDINYKFFNTPCVDKKNLVMSKWDRGEHFEFAYCITTHLSQGGQAPSVIYFEEPSMPMLKDKLNYTGITRAESRLIYVKRKKLFPVRQVSFFDKRG